MSYAAHAVLVLDVHAVLALDVHATHAAHAVLGLDVHAAHAAHAVLVLKHGHLKQALHGLHELHGH
jgi:hypothetical protein